MWKCSEAGGLAGLQSLKVPLDDSELVAVHGDTIVDDLPCSWPAISGSDSQEPL